MVTPASLYGAYCATAGLAAMVEARNSPAIKVLISSPPCLRRLWLPVVSGGLLQLELDDVDRRGADVLDRARRAGILPEELAGAQPPAAVGLARHALDDLAAVDHDPHAGRALFDGGNGLAGLQ